MLLGLGVLACSTVRGQSITIIGGWERTLTEADLQSGPGSSFQTTYESPIDAVLVDISVPPSDKHWKIGVRMDNTGWYPTLQIWARRTGEGTAWKGFVMDGTVYQQITPDDLEFFRGMRDRSSIPIQYQIRNVSAAIPAALYSAEIVYTLEER
jgi:hypothetical protein